MLLRARRYRLREPALTARSPAARSPDGPDPNGGEALHAAKPPGSVALLRAEPAQYIDLDVRLALW